MRDILNDLEAGKYLSDPDPVRRAQINMKAPVIKRFYSAADVGPADDGFVVQLDGKPVRTPGRNIVSLPTHHAAALVAGEFSAQVDIIDPVSMPVTRLVNTAIDGVAADPHALIEDILRFCGSDLLCYRAGEPLKLAQIQAEAWDPILAWAGQTIGARMVLAEGVIHVEQPPESIEAIGRHLRERDEPIRLSAIHLMTTLTGSALIALAVESRAISAEAAWTAAHVDEDWNVERWGMDAEAVGRRAARLRDMMAAVALLQALDGQGA